MYIPDLSPLYDFFKIQYLVAHEPQDLSISTPFQAYTFGIVQSADALLSIAELPQDVLELFIGQPDIAANRVIRGGYYVQPMESPVVEPWLRQSKRPFCCVWSTTIAIATELRSLLDEWPSPILHVTPDGAGFGLSETSIDRRALRAYVAEVVAFRERTGMAGGPTSHLRAHLEQGDTPAEAPLVLAPRRHFLTTPNEAALRGAGFTLAEVRDDPLVGIDNAPYLAALERSVQVVVAERTRALAMVQEAISELVPCDIILTVPSSTKYTTEYLGTMSKDVPERTRNLLRQIVRQIDRRETYNFRIPNPGSLESAFGVDEVRGILTINTMEMRAYTAALAVRASSNMVPVIRLPPSAGDVRQHIIALGNTARSTATPQNRRRKLSQVAQRLSDQLAKGVPSWVMDHLRGRTAVKLISDAPLEWFPLDGLPLALRANVSRIATTPGSLLVQQAIGMREIILPPEALDEVLILRAFSDDDPLRGVLTFAASRMADIFADGKPRLKYVDVRTRGELIDALNAFDGALVVYDGHGSHPKDSDIGMLALPDEEVNTWELRGNARIPPIVLLSACDTHPFDASHATTANGFLAAGAHTVIGTQLPVQGIESGLFVARLLLRISQYMQVLLNRPHQSMRWSEFMPGLQRRQYVTEVLHAVDGSEGIRLGPEKLAEITLEVGIAIDTGDTAWYELLVGMIGEEAKLTEDRVRAAIRREAYLTDALLHVQFGNPDRVVIARQPERLFTVRAD